MRVRILRFDTRSTKRPAPVRRTLSAGGVTLGLVLVVAGCTSTTAEPSRSTATVTASQSAVQTPSSTAAPSSTSTPPATTGTPSSSPSPTATATAKTDAAAPAHQCADQSLAVSVRTDVEGNGLSHRGFFVVFQNTGRSRCELRGAPGVSLVGRGDGQQLGAAAKRTEVTSPPTVELAPDGYAVAKLDTEEMDDHGGVFADGHGDDPRCRVTKADGYRIYPPHSYKAVFVKKAGLYACTTQVHWQSIAEVDPGDRVTGFHA